MENEKLPDALKPYLSRLRSVYEPIKRVPKRLSNSNMQPIRTDMLEKLAKRLSKEDQETCQWMIPDKLSLLSEEDALAYEPLPPQAFFYKWMMHRDVSYSTFSASQNDSFIEFKTSCTGTQRYGRIFSIFIHHRSPTQSENLLDTWLHVQSFPPIPTSLENFNPFRHTYGFHTQACLRAWGPTEDCIVKLDEVVAHCSWVLFKPGELNLNLKIHTVGLVSMAR